MKKTRAGRKPVASGKAAPKSVDEYLTRVPKSSHEAFLKLREAVGSAVPPGAVETISYGIPAFRQEKVLVWYAAFANHCSLFPTGSVIAAFKSDLKGYTMSKGTIQFPLSKAIPVALVRRIVKARVAAVGAAEKAKRRK